MSGRAACVLALVAGCAGAPENRPATTLAADVLSDSGALRVELSSSPAGVPVRGDNTVTLAVSRTETGEPVADLALSMVPFMPAMGHGSSAVPSFSAQGGGHYRFTNVVLTMPGAWELRTSITGAEIDSVVFGFDVD